MTMKLIFFVVDIILWFPSNYKKGLLDPYPKVIFEAEASAFKDFEDQSIKKSLCSRAFEIQTKTRIFHRY